MEQYLNHLAEELDMPVLQVIYIGFFSASFLILFLILCAGAPYGMKAVRRCWKQMRALQTRKQLALADLNQLELAAQSFHGLYLFTPVKPLQGETSATDKEPASVASVVSA